jgi:hypothetical protein
MNLYQFIYTSIFSCFLLLSSACSFTNQTYENEQKNPFIFNDNEFKRATFKRPFEEPKFITICYNKYGILPETISDLANKECAKYNKSAEYVRQSFLICPLFTPIAVIYNCCSNTNEVTKSLDVLPNSKSITCKRGKL